MKRRNAWILCIACLVGGFVLCIVGVLFLPRRMSETEIQGMTPQQANDALLAKQKQSQGYAMAIAGCAFLCIGGLWCILLWIMQCASETPRVSTVAPLAELPV